ncbi:Ureidoglycolate lyase [Cyphellophora attinorum]|uniref:Ureidoglycolate lyase n=1 Tax=Cyphellophora attinorum TaxID=1664694 RepID=A0A0N1NWZ4_9EURO|nr:Ureidoglycolate lyase [Phialophora attinorum]KPI34554.1 Ureidoglycolate lyase [Phialophora attinorum]
MTYGRLIRFLDEDSVEHYGEPIIDHADDLLVRASEQILQATVLTGTSIFTLDSRTTGTKKVAQILPLLTSSEVPLIRCIGLNYLKHIKEGGRSPPPYPSVFTKPSTSIASYNEDIPIPFIAQHDQLDYEGELAILIGRTGKDISKANALDYVAGYAVSNDVSARTWQRKPEYAGPVPQWDFSKGFDKFAPLGPLLVSPSLVNEASGLRLQTWVNGELRQDSDTSDMLFGVREIVAFISQGTTLQRGTVILTGTPAGVAMGMKPHPLYLKDQDVVKVRIEGLGFVENKMVFEKRA